MFTETQQMPGIEEIKRAISVLRQIEILLNDGLPSHVVHLTVTKGITELTEKLNALMGG